MRSVNTSVAGIIISFTDLGIFFYIASIALRSPQDHRTARMSFTRFLPTAFRTLQGRRVIQIVLATIPTQDRMVHPYDFETGQKWGLFLYPIGCTILRGISHRLAIGLLLRVGRAFRDTNQRSSQGIRRRSRMLLPQSPSTKKRISHTRGSWTNYW
jgi:hypothetical protein